MEACNVTDKLDYICILSFVIKIHGILCEQYALVA